MGMTINPRGRGFEAYVRAKDPDGNYVRKRRTLPSYPDAEAWGHKALADILAGRQVDKPAEVLRQSKTLKDAADYTLEERWAKTCKTARGAANQRTTALQWLELLGADTKLSSLTTEDILAAKTAISGDLNYKTVNRKLTTLSVILREAVRLGWLGVSPHIPMTPEDARADRRMRYATKAEGEEMSRRMHERGHHALADFVDVLAGTGMRTGELLSLEASKIVNGKIELEVMKGGNERTLPMTTRVREVIHARLGHRSGKLFPDVSQTHLNRVWTLVKGDMGLADDSEFVPHALRHGVGTRLAQANVHKSHISTWLGHRNGSTTDIYIKVAGLDLEPIVGVLD